MQILIPDEIKKPVLSTLPNGYRSNVKILRMNTYISLISQSAMNLMTNAYASNSNLTKKQCWIISKRYNINKYRIGK